MSQTLRLYYLYKSDTYIDGDNNEWDYSSSIFKCSGCNEWNLDSRYCYSNIDVEQIYCLNCVNIKPQAFEQYREHYNPYHPRLKGVPIWQHYKH